jgi:hypothetical protein
MCPIPKSGIRTVLSSGKIDGGAYRIVETPDGGAMVEEWRGGTWVPGGAGYGEVRDAPPVTPEFAAMLGIPFEDLQAVSDRPATSSEPLVAMIDSPGPFSSLATWEQYLSELRALPANTIDRDHLIECAEQTIARKRQESEKPPEQADYFELPILDDHNRMAGATRLKPDYGLRLLKDGFSRTADLYFYDFRLFSISVLGNGNYSAVVDNRYDGEMHALSLDFNHVQLEQILLGSDPSLTAFIRAELSKDPVSPREIELDEYMSFGVRARLGPLQQGANEQFVPLVAQEIFHVSLTPADSNKPIMEWEEAVLDHGRDGRVPRSCVSPSRSASCEIDSHRRSA